MKSLSFLLFFALPLSVSAHGFAGARFFPATLTTEDPFVADELSLPTISTIITPDDGGTRETEVSFDISRRLTDRWSIEIGNEYRKLAPPDGKTTLGFGNLEIGTKYEIIRSDAHEAIFSLGLDAELGGTGRKLVGADSFTTYTPSLFFGKGLGDLPASLAALRPLALTGSFGAALPSSGTDRTLQYGFALEYSFIYLQQQVKNVGLKAPFDRLIPLVEFSFETPLATHQTTGTINPGLIWSGKYFQLGAEAVIPVNSRTGANVGAVVQLHFYLDDLLPKVFGKPLFGGRKL